MGDRAYRLWRSSDRAPGAIEVKLSGLLDADSVDPRMAQAAVGATGAAAAVAPTMEQLGDLGDACHPGNRDRRRCRGCACAAGL